MVGEIQRSLDTLTQDSTCLLNSEALRTTTDLLQVCQLYAYEHLLTACDCVSPQGNVDRCNRVISHVDSTKANMFMVRSSDSIISKLLETEMFTLLGTGPKVASVGCLGQIFKLQVVLQFHLAFSLLLLLQPTQITQLAPSLLFPSR